MAACVQPAMPPAGIPLIVATGSGCCVTQRLRTSRSSAWQMRGSELGCLMAGCVLRQLAGAVLARPTVEPYTYLLQLCTTCMTPASCLLHHVQTACLPVGAACKTWGAVFWQALVSLICTQARSFWPQAAELNSSDTLVVRRTLRCQVQLPGRQLLTDVGWLGEQR